MAKKTKNAFHTGLTIRQVKTLLRKVENLERQLADQANQPPDMVYISYDAEKNRFTIHEDFFSGSGKKKAFDHRNTRELPSLQAYIFPANFYGQCLLDLMELPEETGNIFAFNTGLLRAEHGLLKQEFSLEFIGHCEGSINSEFNIITYGKDNENND